MDIHALVTQLFDSVMDIKCFRKPPPNVAELTPFLVYQVTSPVGLSNSNRGTRITLVLNIVADDFPTAVGEANKALNVATDIIPHTIVPAGRLTHVSVTSGVVDTSTTLSSSELEQVSMILSGIARKE